MVLTARDKTPTQAAWGGVALGKSSCRRGHLSGVLVDDQVS